MITRLQQFYSKFLFCLHCAGGVRSFLLLVINSKRFNRFQKMYSAAVREKQDSPVKYNLRLGKQQQIIYLRTYAGDIKMFYEIFWEQVYRLPASFQMDKGVIIDAGANIGMAALFFSIHFPGAVIYCIEPVKENCQLLGMNLQKNIGNKRVFVIEAALHAKDGVVSLNDKSWAYNASVSDAGHAIVTSITMPGLLKKYLLEKVDLLKIDIEGAEDIIFSSDTAWLQKVDAILIEIHLPVSVELIRNILSKAGFYWYIWDFGLYSNSVFFASRTAITDSKFFLNSVV